MPPVTRGDRGRDIPEVNLASRGKGRGHRRGPRHQDNARVGNNQDNQADNAIVLEQILKRLDNIETNNQIPGGGANVRIPHVQDNNLPIEDDLVARAQLKDLSKMKGQLFYGTEQGIVAEAWLLNIERCFILHRYLVKVRWMVLHLRGFGPLW